MHYSQPGTSDFLHSIQSSIKAFSQSIPIDSVVLQAILICLIAGNKNLILRTHQQDLALLTKLAAFTLNSVFDYPTHKLRIRPSQQIPPQVLLRSLFLSQPPSSSNASLNPAANSYFNSHKRRSDSRTSLPSTKVRSRHGLTQHHAESFTRSSSSPCELTTTSLIEPSFVGSSGQLSQFIPSSSAERKLKAKTRSLPHLMTLPKALVVSGLEHVPRASQRALLQVLTERRVVLESDSGNEGDAKTRWNLDENDHSQDGVWNLDEEFMMIYVCALDPMERPTIHKSLLDHFAMSATVNLDPATRQLIRQFVSHSPSPSITPPLNLPATPSFALPADFLPNLRRLHSQIHLPPNLSLYISDLFSATRHHPQLDGTFVTARARKDMDGLVRAERIIGSDPTGAEIIQALAAPEVGDSGERTDDHDHTQDLTLDVSEADVARIVPRVLSHRLRVRDGPEDELLGSMLYGAIKNPATKEVERDEMLTVKDIFVRILAEV